LRSLFNFEYQFLKHGNGAKSTADMSSQHDFQSRVDQLLALIDKEKPLSASDVDAIRQLLAAGASVANGIGKSRRVCERPRALEAAQRGS
jgi:hypothetical protein